MSPVYAETTRAWFDELSRLRLNRVAFWQPTPAQPGQIGLGERWYFKELGAPQILGYGEFAGWERLSITDLFERYDAACGYRTVDELLSALRIVNPSAGAQTEIGNIILENFTPFGEPISLQTLGLQDLSVRFAYLSDADPIASYIGGQRPNAPVTEFSLRNEDQARRAAASRKVRIGQDDFRERLILRYGPICAFTGLQLVQTLQAAHIQPYVDEKSNHIRNGLLLRADMHRLFDLGLMTLTIDLRIRVSNRIINLDADVRDLHGTQAKLDATGGILPSTAAIEFHAREIFED